MDNLNQELEEFDLESILREFGDEPAAESAAETPPVSTELPPMTGETSAPVSQPEEPEAVQEQAGAEASSEEAPAAAEAPALEGNTVRFTPITDDQLHELAQSIRQESAAAEIPAEPVIAPGAPTPPPAEPAFEVEQEFIPSPSLFLPHSELRALKKKLVEGPEKRYYELSESGTTRLQLALLVNLLVVLGCTAVAALYFFNMIPASRMKLVIFSQVLALLVSGLMGSNLMIDSLSDLFRGRFTAETLLSFSFFACIADAALCLKELRVPCCAAFSLSMLMALWARLHTINTEMAQLDTLRKAVRLTAVKKADDFCDHKAGFLRSPGNVDDFTNQYRKMSTPQVIQGVYALLCLIICTGISVLAGFRYGLSMALQILSTSMLVAVPSSFFVFFTRPTMILETRLHMVGTVLCGWAGVKGLCGKGAFPIFDLDLFPKGSVKLNGVKFYGDEDPVDVVSYTASVIQISGGALVPVFTQLLSTRGGSVYHVQSFRRYSGGGIGGEVRGLPVLIGSLNFLQDMGVDIPDGTMVNQAVYAAIDGQLSAVYAISYAKMRSASAGLVTLCGCRKITPVMLCGDFMLTESFLRSRFNVKTRRISFPQPEDAAALSRVRPPEGAPALALTTREELVSAAYAVTGARALRTAARLGLIIHLAGGILGLLIMLAMAILGNTELLIPSNILLYQLVWCIPGLLITEWTRVL